MCSLLLSFFFYQELGKSPVLVPKEYIRGRHLVETGLADPMYPSWILTLLQPILGGITFFNLSSLVSLDQLLSLIHI